ncbi:MAG: TonB-dependent receptor plug domain-containing protein, partial [Methylococcales bacterium]|nr:TonB-dependent receptor plug domain-containing protein [Methylococcales bacterium]
MKHKIVSLLAYLLMTLSHLCVAADDFSTANTPLGSNSDVFLQDIPSVYSASKYEQKVTKAPASISIVTADEIKKWGYRTFGDILASLKGFYSTNDRNYGYAGARGFGVTSDYNTRLLLLIDGHRFNDNIYEAFDTSEGFPVDLDVIERIEVVRGPGSALYGSNAFFGVINVITKRGRDQKGVNVKASYGSNDAYKTSISVGDRFKSGLETFLSGTFYNSQGFNKLYYSEFDNPLNNNGVSVGNDAEQDKKIIAKAALGDFAFEGVYVKRNKDVPTASFGTLFNNSNYNTINEATFLELKYEHIFDNQLNLQSRLSYNSSRFNADYPYVGATTSTT